MKITFCVTNELSVQLWRIYIRVYCVWYLFHDYLPFAASYQSSQGNQGESDPNNTTVGCSTWYMYLSGNYLITDSTVLSADICWWFGPKCF